MNAYVRNESAFPMESGSFSDKGMTLRDYFAAHCPITFEQAMNNSIGYTKPFEFWAALRYEYADAMLAERAKK